MSTSTAHPAGVPSWIAQLSPDVEGSRTFYAALFAWDFDNVAPPGEPPFYIASLDGQRVASLAGPDDTGTWIVAVSVEDLDAARDSAHRLGGAAPGDSVRIPTLGRFHRIDDPAGAEIHLVQADSGRLAGRLDAPNAWQTSILDGIDDPSSVADFYHDLLGWQIRQSGTAIEFWLPQHDVREHDVVAHLRPTDVRDGTRDRPARWTPEFSVADVDTMVATVSAEGGVVLEPSSGSRRGLRTALLTDPWGATFSVSQCPSRGQHGPEPAARP